MKKKISMLIVIFIIVSVTGVLLWYATIPKHYRGPIPSRDLEDRAWEVSMFAGEGANYMYTKGGLRKDPPISLDANLAREDPSFAVYQKSGIILRGPDTFDGYWGLVGGLIDWVEGDEYRIELYGKEASRWQNFRQWPVVWDNYVHERTYDYFLLKRNKRTNEAILIKEWRRMAGAYGILLYEKDKNKLIINICGTTVKETIFPDVKLIEDNLSFITCTTPSTSSKQ